MRPIIYVFFPLLGLFDYLKGVGLPTIGYIIFMLPICLSLLNFGLIGLTHRLRTRVRTRYNKNRILARPQMALFAIYIVLILLGFIVSVKVGARPFLVGSAEFLLFAVLVVFFATVLAQARDGRTRVEIMDCIGNSLFLLVLMNLGAAGLGFKNPGLTDNYLNDLQNIFGIAGYAEIFPFTSSGRMFAIQSGVLTIIGIFRFANARKYGARWLGIAMTISGLVVLIVHGGRGPILALVGIMMMASVWRISKHFAVVVVILVAMFPLLVAFSQFGFVVEGMIDGDVISSLSVSEGDFASFSNRDKIFSTVLVGFFVSSDWWELTMGYGAFGQVTSGLSESYSLFFTNSYADPYRVPTHNTVLQILVDYGVVGLIIFVALCINLIRWIIRLESTAVSWERQAKTSLLLASISLYIMGTSAMETSITYYAFGVWSLFIFLNIYVISASMDVPGRRLLVQKTSR